jgi:CheY-like chemotaxis protein
MSLLQFSNILDGWSIVIVDDDKNSSQVLQTTLKITGAQMYFANNARAGYELVRMQHPNLIITDIHMPKYSGCDMWHMICTDLSIPPTPVVVVSADEYLPKCGFDQRQKPLAHFVKPILPSQFLPQLIQVLGLKPAISEV